MHRLFVAVSLFVLGLAGCGGGSSILSSPSPPPGVTYLPFAEGEGKVGYNGIVIWPPDHFPDGWYWGCMDCARVLTVAQDRAAADAALGFSSVYLDKVDFSTSSVIVFDRVAEGQTLRLTITAVEERADGLTVRSSYCAHTFLGGINAGIVGVIVIPKRFKPAVFAPADTTTNPPAIAGMAYGTC